MSAARSRARASTPSTKIWDNGFRQISTSTGPIETPADLENFKIRVPVSPLWTSMFTAFGAAPTSINFAEVYTALQTGVVDGQENPLAILSNFKLWEVQKYVSMTNHMWDGFWMLANRRSWGAVPEDLQEIVATNFNASAVEQRADIEALNATPAGRARGQRHGLQHPRDRALPAEAASTPASTRSGRASSATRPGRSSRTPPGSRSADADGRDGR